MCIFSSFLKNIQFYFELSFVFIFLYSFLIKFNFTKYRYTIEGVFITLKMINRSLEIKTERKEEEENTNVLLLVEIFSRFKKEKFLHRNI